MKRIIYTSQANPGTDEDTLKAILATAREENPKHDVTGMLLFGDGMFIQVLEGANDDIDNLCGAIKGDDRHSNFEYLYEEEIDDRAFTDWSMAYRVLDDNMISKLGGSMDASSEQDLINFLRGDDHFVKGFLAACLKEISETT